MSRLGNGLDTDVRNNFSWFVTEWDKVCCEKHKDDLPEIFMRKLQGVLNALPANPKAFTHFIQEEERLHFKGMYALTVPPSVPPGLVAIGN